MTKIDPRRYPRYSQEHALSVTILPTLFADYSNTQLESIMAYRPNEIAIDEIVASCDGDVHGALKALLLVNEQLEAEIARLHAAVTRHGSLERGAGALH